jgi:hypothetical protein
MSIDDDLDPRLAALAAEVEPPAAHDARLRARVAETLAQARARGGARAPSDRVEGWYARTLEPLLVYAAGPAWVAYALFVVVRGVS